MLSEAGPVMEMDAVGVAVCWVVCVVWVVCWVVSLLLLLTAFTMSLNPVPVVSLLR